MWRSNISKAVAESTMDNTFCFRLLAKMNGMENWFVFKQWRQIQKMDTEIRPLEPEKRNNRVLYTFFVTKLEVEAVAWKKGGDWTCVNWNSHLNYWIENGWMTESELEPAPMRISSASRKMQFDRHWTVSKYQWFYCTWYARFIVVMVCVSCLVFRASYLISMDGLTIKFWA